jgi:hypothetical protein
MLHLSMDGEHFDFETVIPASYEIIEPDVGTVMVCSTVSGTEERSALFQRGIHAFEPTSTWWSFRRSRSIPISDSSNDNLA